MKFLIVNSFHRDDKGDASLLHVLIDQLLAIDPKADVSIMSMEDPNEYQNFRGASNIGSFEFHSSSHKYPTPLHLIMKVYIFAALLLVGWSKGRFKWIFTSELSKIYDKCAAADLVVSVGGGYFITKRDLGSRIHLLFAIQTLLFCKQLGRKVATAPVSVGPFQYDFEAKYASWQLRKLDLLLLREDVSKKYFVNSEGELPSNIRRAPDSAFVFEPIGEFDIRTLIGAKQGDMVLALSVRNWMTADKQIIYEQAHADLIDNLAAKYPHIKPVFVPQCTFPRVDDDDRAVAAKIVARSKSKNAFLITEALDYQKVKLAYAKADYVIGTRFHAMVFSLTYLVPGIAVEYEHKTRGIMRDLGLEDWVIKIGDINSEKLLSLFERLLYNRDLYRMNLSNVIPSYAQRARQTQDEFKFLINR